MKDRELDDIVNRVSNALDVPEPSPLFWEHFPDRVRAAVQAEPAVVFRGSRCLHCAKVLARPEHFSLDDFAISHRCPLLH